MNEDYLGDGLYVSFDVYQFILRAPRPEGDHYVALEPEVLAAFLKYVDRVKEAVRQDESSQEVA